jgi:hypothetical protein
VSLGLVLAAAVAVALPAAATGASSSATTPARAAANSTTYQDSTGEDPAGADITTLVVSNNDARLLTFRINIPNRPTFTRDMLIGVNIDTDNNAATGDEEGSDYAIELTLGEIFLYRWDGTAFTRRPGDPPAVSLVFSYQGGVTIGISAAELGNTTRFKFSAVAISGIVIDETTGEFDFANARADFAPAASAGAYAYELRVTPPTLVVRRVTTVPRAPRAGKTFTMRLVAARSDTGAVLQSGRVTCVGRAGNTRLRARVARVTAGAATCTWNIPANAKGKRFRGTVTVVFEGLRAKSSISRRIA